MGLLELGPLGLTGARPDLDDLPLVVADDGDGLDVAQGRQTTRGWLPGVITDDDRRDGTYRQTASQAGR